MAAVSGNYHTHSRYSDGKAALEEYILEAKKQGMKYLGFSEHSPLPFPNTFALKEETIGEYFRDLRHHAELARQEASIALFAGLEMDYIPGFSQDFQKMQQKHQVDFLIGSVHLVLSSEAEGLWFIDGPSRQTYDDGLNYYFRGDIRAGVTAFYRQTQQMIRQERFDIIGHLDKIKMHNQNRYFSGEESWYQALVLETLEEIKAKGVIVEVNTRGVYKQRSDSFFPGPLILKQLHQMNIPVMLSSDAHEPGELSLLFPEALEMLRTIGFSSVMLLSGEGWIAQGIGGSGL